METPRNCSIVIDPLNRLSLVHKLCTHIINVRGVLEKLNLYIGAWLIIQNYRELTTFYMFSRISKKDRHNDTCPPHSYTQRLHPGTHNGRPYKHMGH